MRVESNPSRSRYLPQLFRASTMGGRSLQLSRWHFSELALLTLSLLALLNTALADGMRQTYVVRYKKGGYMIPVTVVLDYKKQTEYVINMHPRTAAKSVTFYDFKERVITYKDLDNKECFIGRLTRETLREESAILENIKGPVEDEPLVLTLEPNRPSLTPTEVKNIAGHKTALFCRLMNTWVLQSHGNHTRSRRQTREEEVTRRTYSHHGQSTHKYSYHGYESYERRRTPTRNALHRRSRNDNGSPRTRHKGLPTENQLKSRTSESRSSRRWTSEAKQRLKDDSSHVALGKTWLSNDNDEAAGNLRNRSNHSQNVDVESSRNSPSDETSTASHKSSHRSELLSFRQGVDEGKGGENSKVAERTNNREGHHQTSQRHSLTDLQLRENSGTLDRSLLELSPSSATPLPTNEKSLPFSISLTSGAKTGTNNYVSRALNYGNDSDFNPGDPSKKLDHKYFPTALSAKGIADDFFTRRESSVYDNRAEYPGYLVGPQGNNTSYPPIHPGRRLQLRPSVRNPDNRPSYIDSDHVDVQESSALYTDPIVVPQPPVVPHWYSTIAKEISIPLDLSFPSHKDSFESYQGEFPERDNVEQTSSDKTRHRPSLVPIHVQPHKSALEIRNAHVRPRQHYLALEAGFNKKIATRHDIYDYGNLTDRSVLEQRKFDPDRDITHEGSRDSFHRPHSRGNGDKFETGETETHSLIYRNHNLVASHSTPLQVDFALNENVSNAFTDSPGVGRHIANSRFNDTASRFGPNVTSRTRTPSVSTTPPWNGSEIIGRDKNGENYSKNSFMVSNVNVSEDVPILRPSSVLHLFTPDETVIDVTKSHSGRQIRPTGNNSASKRRFLRIRNKTNGALSSKKTINRNSLSPNVYETKHRTHRGNFEGRKDLKLGLRSGSTYHHRSFEVLPPGVSVHPRHPQAPYAELASDSAKRIMMADSLRHRVDHPTKHRHLRHYRKRDRNLRGPSNDGPLSCCTGRRRNQQPSSGSCCQDVRIQKNLVNLRQSVDTDVASKDTVEEERCLKEKMCRTVYRSTRQVLVCRNIDIAGC